jgi:two-component system LytT family response regulator
MLEMLRILIVDDEAPARRRVRRLLSAEPDAVIVGECADGQSALAVIAKERPDLVFLDVQMPQRDGFAVVREMRSGFLPEILFVTAHDRYALRAFDVHAVDYLLKPFSADRFKTALQRARERIDRRSVDRPLANLAARLRPRPAYLSRVPVSTAGRTRLVDLEEVDWLEAADNYVRLHAKEREYLLRETLVSLEQQIDPDRFVRVHRSAIVAVDRVAEIRPQSHGDAVVVLDDGTRIPVSRTWRERLQAAIDPRRR